MSRFNDEYYQNGEIPRPDEADSQKWWDAFEDEDDLLKEEELKDKYAFALDVDAVTGMPRVVAMGRGLIAKKIEEQARAADVRLEKDPDMTRRLFTPADDRVIPTQVYGIIAEILTFVFQVNELMARGEEPPEEETGEEPEEETETKDKLKDKGEAPEETDEESFEGDEGDKENLVEKDHEFVEEYEEIE